MKVDDPKFNIHGEVSTCRQCPLSPCRSIKCYAWTKHHYLDCPKAESYEDACAFANGGPL